jgi:hypothetical protein
LELRETINAAQRPVKFVSATNTETVVKITEYTKNKITLNVSGVGNHNIVIENGDFVVKKGALYDASTVKNADGSYTVTVTSGSGMALDSDVITIPITLRDYYLVDNFNLNNTESLDDYRFSGVATIEALPTYKDRSLKLTSGVSAAKNIDANFNAYVLSQKILIRSASVAENSMDPAAGKKGRDVGRYCISDLCIRRADDITFLNTVIQSDMMPFQKILFPGNIVCFRCLFIKNMCQYRPEAILGMAIEKVLLPGFY